MCGRDWSSDVCSSDLYEVELTGCYTELLWITQNCNLWQSRQKHSYGARLITAAVERASVSSSASVYHCSAVIWDCFQCKCNDEVLMVDRIPLQVTMLMSNLAGLRNAWGAHRGIFKSAFAISVQNIQQIFCLLAKHKHTPNLCRKTIAHHLNSVGALCPILLMCQEGSLIQLRGGRKSSDRVLKRGEYQYEPTALSRELC